MKHIRKIAGFSVTLLFVSLSFMLFQFVVRKESNFDVLVGAGLFVLFYSAPFILLGGFVTYLIDKVISKDKQLIGYFLIGVFISVLISVLFSAYSQTATFLFVIGTSIFGAVIFYFSSRSNNKLFNISVGIGIPIVLLLLLFL